MRDDFEQRDPERDGSQIGESGDANEPEENDGLDDVARPSPGLIERLRRLTDGSARARKPLTKAELSQDRTRPLLLLIGGIVGAVLLFLGVFSTPPMRNSTTDSAQPNLGRRSPAGLTGADEQLASVIPLLSANLGGRASETAPLSAEDILGTSTRTFEPDEEPDVSDWRETLVQAAPREVATRSSIPENNTVDEATPRDELPTFSYGSGSLERAADPSPEAKLAAPSIVFVRSPETASTPGGTSVPTAVAPARPALLRPGSRLIARLESAVTTALNAPVVAAIEYNYERDGVIVVPAGATAIGEIQQAAASGHIGIAFHSLRMPDGRQERIRAIAMSLDHEPLKGEVSGENTVKKVLSRALSGIGTMAAYVVGAGGAGLNRPVTGGSLLRDRVATNIAQAGEQEFANAAYSENIVVTIPAQTRFYVVLEESALEESSTLSAVGSAIGPGALPSAEELQELIDLKREIDRLYGSSLSAPLASQ